MAFSNLSGTATLDIEIPLNDTMVYKLTLQDADGVDLDLTGNTFEFHFFNADTSRNYKWKVSGVLVDDGFGVTFTKATSEKIGSGYYYRVYKTDGDGVTTTSIRGKFKVS